MKFLTLRVPNAITMGWSAQTTFSSEVPDRPRENFSNTMEVGEKTCHVRITLTSPTILEAVRDLNIRPKECERRYQEFTSIFFFKPK